MIAAILKNVEKWDRKALLKWVLWAMARDIEYEPVSRITRIYNELPESKK